MMINLTLSTAILLACTSIVAAAGGVITVPMKSLVKPQNQNSRSMNARYHRKRSTTTSTALTSANGDVMYTVSLGVGTPPQYFNLAIDTGSPITWMVSKDCTTATCDQISNHFDCEASSTCTASPASGTLNASYVSGDSIYGSYVEEMFTLGSLHFPSLAGVVSSDSAQLPPTVDGIMGLWFGAPSDPKRQKNVPLNAAFLSVLSNTTVLAQKKVGIWIASGNSPDKNAPGGEITFGGVDPARYTGDFTYVDCVVHPPWTIPVERVSINGQNFNVGGSLATIDTGTTAMLLPAALAHGINSAIAGSFQNYQGEWFIPCSGGASLSITVGGLAVTIPYTTLAMQNLRYNDANITTPYCLSAAMYAIGETVPIKQWLLGDVFLKSVYSVFDFGTNAATGGRIGFAKLSPTTTTTTTTTAKTTGGNGDKEGSESYSFESSDRRNDLDANSSAQAVSTSRALLVSAIAMGIVSAML
ncbi:aspartic peptidase domain-containing protein [Dissophora ornata]|nr:hypothetical protein BGZ58_004729 [Dissophora ornata]KAI8600770.1 aspartic peptidase domain-containing protein [Dissophora ornata]